MKRNHCLLLSFLLFTITIFAQNNYHFRTLTTADGLSQSSVIAIHQDKLGQMWFGTRDGLNKYDGNSFTVYHNKPTDSLSISNNDILSIQEDSSGSIWIGTYNGLNKYDPVTNSFQRYFHNTNSSSLADNTIWTIEEINDEIWIGTSNGLSIYNKKTNSFNSVYHDQNNPNSLRDNYVLSILKTKDGDIWVGTAKGLCKLVRRENTNFTFKTYENKVSYNKNENSLFVQDLIEDSYKNIWIASKTSGLYKIEPNSDALISYKETKELDNFDTDFRAMSFDDKGNLWLGSYSGITIGKPFGTFENIFNKPDEFTALSKIKSIYTDKKGSVWIGTYYGGVSIWDKANVNFTSIDQNTRSNALSYNVVGSIVADQNNNVYFGTEGGGITILDTKTGVTSYINEYNSKQLASDNIKSMLLLNNELWIGTFTAGLSIYNTKTKQFNNQKLAPNLQKLLQQTGVYVLEKENENSIWLGTFGKGIIRYDVTKKTFRNFQNIPTDSSSLTNNRIRSILIDSNKRVWIGSQSGLNLLDLKYINEKNIRFKNFFYNKEIISGVDILTLFEDHQKNIWVGTKAKGFYKFNGENFEKQIIKDGDIEITSVHSVLEDELGNLWLSSNQGIAKYNPESKEVTMYDQTDGLISNEFNTNSVLKLNNREFYFGGPAGVSYFNPQNISINDYSPQVILTNFKVKNESIEANKENDILEKSISYTNKITLSYDKANFSINFAIPNFINSTNNQYSYRLVGLEDEWIATKNNEATYTIQKPGTYIFEVKGANNDGVWNKTPTTLQITVKPAPWRSWWAFTLYALLLALALLGLIMFLKSKAKLKHELELEHIENVRIEEINQAKLQFFTNISHEFRTPLTLILGPLQQLLMDYKGSNKMYKKLLVIESSANHLLQLINRLMDFRKLENNQFNLQSAEGNIVKFLREIYLSFSEYAKDGNYTYSFTTSDEEILIYYDRTKLERVFYNLISNAFRYTPKGGAITINLIKKEKNLVIEVEDSGVGIVEEYLDKIFDRFFEIPIHNQPQENYNKGTGIGLSIAKNIVKLHKGYIQVANKTTSKGTVFTVTLPLGSEHLSEAEILKDFKISDDISQYESQLDQPQITLDEEVDDLVVTENKQTILVVEDNKPLRSFIKNLLKKDYNIIEAENGKVAMSMALKHIPDLVISDVIMPVMVGTELCSRIKENLKTSHIPVILLTSRTSLIYKFEGLESGADEYISKPFNVKEFQLRIKNIIDSTLRLKNKFSSEDNLTPSEITVSSIDEKLLKKAFKIVEDNIANDQFDIPFFSSELGVSRTMLFTKIKAWTNFTPNEFIHEIRMKRAAQLLEQNKINIAQVSYKAGFKNPKYFSKCFQKKYGVTPTQYQNKFSDSFNL